jgi:5'-3' exonuclease
MLLAVDYSSLLYRAYHSLPDHVPMRGVLGFLNMLARLVTDRRHRRPTRLAIAVDEDWRPDFRVAALPTYKAHRVATEGGEEDPVAPQEEVGREVLRAMGIAVLGAPGYEAEDAIATLVAHTREPVEIVSGDRDLFALVRDPDVRVLYPLVGVSQLAIVDEAEITRRYDIPGRTYLDFAILRGDPSDGLPGVPGIGAKTAARLIGAYGSLSALLASPEVPVAIRRRLDAARDYLDAARRVVPPATDVPLPRHSCALPRAPAHPRTLARLAKTHGLTNAVGRVTTALAAARIVEGRRSPPER